MLVFILKFSGCLLVFLAFYKFILEKESFHVFKRFYLLAALLLSIGIPYITFTEYIATEINTHTIGNTELIITSEEYSTSFKDYFLQALLIIYIIGVLIFSSRFIINLKHIITKIQVNIKHKKTGFINVLLHTEIVPHTFFKYIFLNKKKYENNEIPEEVLIHEQAHAKQKHSLDIIFVELFQIIFWFHPLIYIIKHSIKLNHEFLADKAVINRGVNTTFYKQTLLAFSSNACEPKLANAFNYSSIKKRFTIMKTQTSKSKTCIKSFLLLPLLAILIFSFSSKKVIVKETPQILLPQEKSEISNYNSTIQKELEKINGLKISYTDTQQTASKKEIAEYNKLAKYYNENLNNEHITIKMKDVKKLKYIYSIMSDKQRKNAEPFPDFPMPPATPEINEAIPPKPPVTYNISPEHKKTKKENNTKHNVIAPTPPKAPNAKEMSEVPPPPPPLNMEQLAKENAVFYYEDKKVSPKEAIKIYNANKELNVQVIGHGKKQPTVKISKEPIKFRKKH